jgi:hypothetical protein
MINITYDRNQNKTKVEVSKLDVIKQHLPLKVQFKNIITDEIHYEAELKDYYWVEWCGSELITDVLIYSSNGTLLHEYKWDVTNHGDEIEKMLWFYLKSKKIQGIKSNGLVIGSHDGRNGHWIYPVKHRLTDATLVDGSDKQYVELIQNYKNNSNIETLNTIVTTDGSDVEWYQGGEGYTDTIVPSFINSWLDSSEIVKSYRKSVSINNLMKDKNYDWLHLDVEGIDGDLILALENKPNVIIYESMNLDKIMEAKLNLWFVENSYEVTEYNGNTIAIKKLTYLY